MSHPQFPSAFPLIVNINNKVIFKHRDKIKFYNKCTTFVFNIICFHMICVSIELGSFISISIYHDFVSLDGESIQLL